MTSAPHAQFASEFVPDTTPSFTLERHIASLRDTDPEKWARLNAEWDCPVGRDAQLVEGVGR